MPTNPVSVAKAPPLVKSPTLRKQSKQTDAALATRRGPHWGKICLGLMVSLVLLFGTWALVRDLMDEQIWLPAQTVPADWAAAGLDGQALTMQTLASLQARQGQAALAHPLGAAYLAEFPTRFVGPDQPPLHQTDSWYGWLRRHLRGPAAAIQVNWTQMPPNEEVEVLLAVSRHASLRYLSFSSPTTRPGASSVGMLADSILEQIDPLLLGWSMLTRLPQEAQGFASKLNISDLPASQRAWATALLGLTEAANGQWSQGLRSLTAAQQAGVRHPALYLAKADLLHKLGDKVGRDQALAQSGQGDFISLALRTEAWYAQEAGDDSSALALLSEAIKRVPDDAEAYVARADFWLYKRQPALAQRDLQQARTLAPTNQMVNNRLRAFHVKQAEERPLQEAFGHIQAAYILAPTDAGLREKAWRSWFDTSLVITDVPDSLRNQAATLCLQAAQQPQYTPEEAAHLLTRALELGTESTAIQQKAQQMAGNRLQNLFSEHAFGPALLWYQDIQRQFGWTDAQLSQIELMLASFQTQSLPLSPQDEVGLLQLLATTGSLDMEQRLQLGHRLGDLGQFEAAEQIFRLAYQMDGRLYTVVLAWAEMLVQAGAREKAAEKFDLATQLGPDAPDVWLAYGFYKLDERQYSQALAHFTQARNLWEKQASASEIPVKSAIDLFSGAAFCGQIMGLPTIQELYYPKAEKALASFRLHHTTSQDQALAYMAEARLAGFQRDPSRMIAGLQQALALGFLPSAIPTEREPFNRYRPQVSSLLAAQGK